MLADESTYFRENTGHCYVYKTLKNSCWVLGISLLSVNCLVFSAVHVRDPDLFIMNAIIFYILMYYVMT